MFESTTWSNSLEDLSYQRRQLEDFWDVHFSCVMVEGSAVSNMDGFSDNFFAVLVCYLEVGDVGLGVVVGKNAVL